MKFAGHFIGFLSIAATIISSAHSEDKNYDLSNKNQFTFYFKENWETIFNTPQPVANPAKERIGQLLASDMYFQPCFTVERLSGNRYFRVRFWGMSHALINCHVDSSVVLPRDPEDNSIHSNMEMEFIQNTTCKSYTNSLHKIAMDIKARKTDANDPYRIYKIVEHCARD